MDVGSMTAMEARTLWLEREMGMLKRVMERETSLQRPVRSDYWRQEVRQDDQPHELLEGDRASGQHGHHEGDRAFRQHGLPEGDRAVKQYGHHEGDRAFRQHGLPEGDRAGKQHGLLEGDRAGKQHGLLEGDRAFRQQGLPEGDRAVQQQGLSEGEVSEWISRDCLIHGRLRTRAQKKKRSGRWIIAPGRKDKPRGGWDWTMRTARTI